MNNVYIAGMGATAVGEHYRRDLADLASEAARAALASAPGIAPNQIGALYVGSAYSEELYGQGQLGAYLASVLGLSPSIPALRIEAAGASGALALYQAVQAVQHGLPLALVIGVEKVTDHLEDAIEAAQAMAADSNEEALHGVTLTAQWAMLMRRYMHEYGYPADAFAPFPINAHANAVKNPLALYRFTIDANKYRKAAMVASPLNLLDCSTLADGAAALLIAGEQLARELAGPRIRIAGAAVATDYPALHRRRNPLELNAARASAHIALGRAHLGVGDVDVWELTDPHGIAATLALEAIGCYEPGTAPRHAAEGAITPTGQTPIATAGGYKARGDVGGASGIYQVIELARQLSGTAGATQVANARIGLAQSLGGIGATAVSHVLIRET
ncbi:thiolase C-terminal domain-containing protein [Chloroflexus sp.]|uniref:thiolase C-terminal domain-containing protein n=1 Tax=Chloroflexus sp. TaxID=1904827 RepID=UPI00298EFAA1|nr:acetyl-CoA acetyltransferase [Chloroflexus sp.]MCS6887131.1 acetyl-CoA acetyltransferase [Chloroflexus sp.]MDW8403231.1 acetyl-CoA acetyltransferase [Chloroflexus sp.]